MGIIEWLWNRKKRGIHAELRHAISVANFVQLSDITMEAMIIQTNNLRLGPSYRGRAFSWLDNYLSNSCNKPTKYEPDLREFILAASQAADIELGESRAKELTVRDLCFRDWGR